ncbi:hypothetical protein ZWY2020_018519 [Hordeum vulgare]|nr:hypothetical protein ZWY2020_018519 [Hordeum vulgare]
MAAVAAAEVSRDAVSALIPCGSFLVGAVAGAPSESCCRGAQALRGWRHGRGGRCAGAWSSPDTVSGRRAGGW